ncbi:MAG: hypothetical protein QM775_33140 [Pirellulales bacterium]
MPGNFVQNNHMSPGSRGVIVYDDFSGKVIATGFFELGNQNVKVNVVGDSNFGYSLAFAASAVGEI